MRKRIRTELGFLRHLAVVNLSSAMEYRASFLTQIVFMFVNNGIYFLFWLIFFEQFGTVRGYAVTDVYLLFGVVALSFGLGNMFAANTGPNLAQLIAQGRLDYYLVMPRTLLPHVICSRMSVSTIGDVLFGLMAFLLIADATPLRFVYFVAAAIPAALIFVAVGTIGGSLAFYIGNAQYVSMQVTNSVLTFALYPHTLFGGVSRFLLYTLVPAAFVGAIPAGFVKSGDFSLLGLLWLVVVGIWSIAVAFFYLGLRRYESGNAINVNV